MTSAYLLVAHGSRATEAQIGLQQLAILVRQQLTISYSPQLNTYSTPVVNKPPIVATACLELCSIPLHEKIYEFALRAAQDRINNVKIIPLFLLPGVHVKEDIPYEVALAKEKSDSKLELLSFLGSYLGIKTILNRKFKHLQPTDERIIVCHGSKRSLANQFIESMATELQARSAYWSVAPSLETQIESLGTMKEKKPKSIAIIPYFLFAGGITEAIAIQVKELQKKFPQIELILGEPLGANKELAELIVEVVK